MLKKSSLKKKKAKKSECESFIAAMFFASLSILFFDMFYSIIMWHNFSGSIVLITGKMAYRMNNKSLSLSAIASMRRVKTDGFHEIIQICKRINKI